jgi:hypothetical protein
VRAGVAKHWDYLGQAHVIPLIFEVSAKHPKVEKFFAFRLEKSFNVRFYNIFSSGVCQLLQVLLSFEIDVRLVFSAKGVKHMRDIF